jgi:class 3 adenylate cyclase
MPGFFSLLVIATLKNELCYISRNLIQSRMNKVKPQSVFWNKSWFIIVLVTLVFYEQPACFSQTKNPYHFTKLTDTTILFDQPWKYHPGDDTTWAAIDFPDHEWDTLSTVLNMSEISDSIFPGKGWFRLNFTIDSLLMEKTWIFSLTQQGASEIYFDGLLVKKSGSFGNEKSKPHYNNPAKMPIPVYFDNKVHHVIAIRYHNEDARYRYENYYKDAAGFSLSISDLSTAYGELTSMVITSNVLMLLIIIFFVLGGLHLLIFLFFRENRSNLYYSIFTFGLGTLFLSNLLDVSVFISPQFSNAFMYYVSLLFPWTLVPLAAMVYNLFYERFPKFFWIIVVLALATSICYYINVSWIAYILMVFVVLVFVEITRVVIRAMIRKKNGAWIMGVGLLFFIVFFSFLIVAIILWGGLVFSESNKYAIFLGIIIIYAIISIPVSMSIYLARDFAKTNKDLKVQLEQVKILSAKSIEQEKEKQKILAGQKDKLEVLVKERTHELEQEKEKTEELLLNTLPLKVVNDLKTNGYTDPESFENVTVYFSDIVGFTNISTSLEPAVLIGELNEIFTAFDDIMERNNCERIKTIGDAYLAVCGMPDKHDNHAQLMARAAIEIREYLEERNLKSEINWKIRIGLHSGKVVGGVVGVRKYIYDVFGDTINTTSRMESNSEPMRINVSETTWQLIRDQFKFTARDPMEIKGKGRMKMYFLES